MSLVLFSSLMVVSRLLGVDVVVCGTAVVVFGVVVCVVVWL